MQKRPSYRPMFSQSKTVTEAKKEQVTPWSTELLDDVSQAREEQSLKTCSVDGNFSRLLRLDSYREEL